MFAGGMIVGLAISSTLPRVVCVILLGVMDTEVIGFEPLSPERRTCDSVREVAELMISNDSIWRIRRPCLDTIESSTSDQASGNSVENCSIDCAGTG